MCVSAVRGVNILVSFHLHRHVNSSEGLSMSYLLLSKQIINQNANVCVCVCGGGGIISLLSVSWVLIAVGL